MNETVLKQLLGEMLESESDGYKGYNDPAGWKFSLKHRIAMKRIFARFDRNARKLKENISGTGTAAERRKPRLNIKQQLLITLCIISLMALLSISAFAIGSSVRSAIARITDPPLEETESGTILYRDDHFTIGVRPADIHETAVPEEIGKPALVEKNEYIEGGYKYVDEIYCQQIASPLRSLKYWSWRRTREIYDITGDSSIHIATLSVKGTFYIGESQDFASIDSDSVEYTAEKHIGGTYPVISAGQPVCRSGIENDKGEPRYARIEITFNLDNASSSDTYPMCIEVNSKNICKAESGNITGRTGMIR